MQKILRIGTSKFDSMIFKNLGRSDLKISSIGLGLGGNFGKYGDLQSIELIKTAVYLGINFFDTAEKIHDEIENILWPMDEDESCDRASL